jgi:hypothetical protein
MTETFGPMPVTSPPKARQGGIMGEIKTDLKKSAIERSITLLNPA